LIVFSLISLILITGSPFQINNDFVENNENLSIKNIDQEVYGEENDGGGDASSDSGDSDSDVSSDEEESVGF
jgi:hypothetical protein